MAETQTGAIYERLVGAPALTSLLAVYRAGPAVFSAPPIPEDVVLPAVVLEPPLDEDRLDTKTTRGTTTLRDINVFVDHTGSSLPLERIVRQVKLALHRLPLSWTGQVGWRARVIRETEAPSDGTILGRSLTVEVSAEEV